jgi:DNA replication and repair protein RecF
LTDSARVTINRLELELFRAHVAFAVDIPEAGLRIHGPNGSGKTTLLEAIQLLSTTRPRAGATDNDLINHASGRDLGLPPFARVVGSFERAGSVVRIEAFIQRGERSGTARKTLKVGDRARRAADVVGLVPTVSFAPDDLDLVLGTPATRRRFLDVLLSQIDRQYLRCLSKYAKILAQRNGLLRRVREGGSDAPTQEQFHFWDEQLVALGSYLVAARVRAVAGLAVQARQRFQHLAPEIGALGIEYQPTIQASAAWWNTVTREAHDTLDAAQRIGVTFERRLRESSELESGRGSTLVGPHRDDLAVTLGEHDIARFGSRGQQRLAVVAIKLAEIDLIAQATSLRPIFLIDDVLSELDVERRAALLDAVSYAGSQLVVTSTDRSLLDHARIAGTGELILPVQQ